MQEDTLYHIHTGHEADRPTTSDFRAALTRMRVAAAALVHSYALPPHPEYSGAAVSPFTAGLFTEASQPQLTHPPLQQPAGSAAPQPPGRLYGLSPHHRPHPQLPLHRPDSPTTAVALSARPSAVSVTAAHGTTALTSAERNRGRTRSGAGVTEDSGGGGGATAGASARSRGAKVAQQVGSCRTAVCSYLRFAPETRVLCELKAVEMIVACRWLHAHRDWWLRGWQQALTRAPTHLSPSAPTPSLLTSHTPAGPATT